MNSFILLIKYKIPLILYHEHCNAYYKLTILSPSFIEIKRKMVD